MGSEFASGNTQRGAMEFDIILPKVDSFHSRQKNGIEYLRYYDFMLNKRIRTLITYSQDPLSQTFKGPTKKFEIEKNVKFLPFYKKAPSYSFPFVI